MELLACGVAVRIAKISVLALAAVAVGLAPAYSASFDCAKASSVPERLICATPSLSQADDEVKALFDLAKAKSSDKSAFVERARREWAERERTCRDVQCLSEWMTRQKAIYLADLDRTSAGSLRGENLAMGQCRVVQQTVVSVAVWRDNGVPIDQSWKNLSHTIAPFFPNAEQLSEWQAELRRIYSSKVPPAVLSSRYERLCNPYRKLEIPVPSPL
ncbi:lysozyme inhibitor LprI family protein [Bordetella hinzii]|uniref:lysozyme inhibitor LprI family protein n=1 Tax=Bordetella hinzii TaxID=103855 RepID=UPI0012D3414B|nr:hypothetical protein [Bordetella hinzii]